MKGRVLIVAGSDSGGGAGIQADIKAVTAMGAFAATAISALTAQNTLGVRGVHPVPASFVTEQLDAVFDDVRVDAVKIGMLATADVIDAVAAVLTARRPPFVVLDPVMAAKSGDRLLAADAVAHLRGVLLPVVDLVTPNLPEAADLLDDSGVGTFCERGRERVALVTIAGQLRFDQAVCGQRAVDFRDEGIGRARLPHLHDRLERVRACLQLSAPTCRLRTLNSRFRSAGSCADCIGSRPT